MWLRAVACLTLLGLFGACNSIFAMGGVGGGGGITSNGKNGGKSKKGVLGSDTTDPWKSIDLNSARDLKKPIVLYIYDQEVQLKAINTTAENIESVLFPDGKVKATLKDFTCVMLTMSGKGWPANFFSQAEKGAAIFLMTCDGTPFGSWNMNNRPSIDNFVTAARQALAANPAMAEKITKVPPPKFKDAPKAGEKDAAAKDPPERKPDTVPCLGGNPEEKKGEDQKPKKKKEQDEG